MANIYDLDIEIKCFQVRYFIIFVNNIYNYLVLCITYYYVILI